MYDVGTYNTVSIVQLLSLIILVIIFIFYKLYTKLNTATIYSILKGKIFLLIFNL